MGEDKPKKSLRLKFKGDSDPRKRRKKHHHRHRSQEQKDESDAEQYGDEQAWVPIHSANDLHGPSYIFTMLDGKCYALGLDPLKRVALLPSNSVNQAEAEAMLAGTEQAGASVGTIDPSPESVYQVWVASRVAGSDNWNFRSAEGMFLSSTTAGLSAQAASRGPLESWYPEPVEVGERTLGAVGLKLKSPQGTYLTASIEGGKPTVGTSTEAGPDAHWQVRVQWKHRHFARAEQAKAQRTRLPPTPQAGIVLSYGASGSGKYRSAEAAVDARAKAKSDKYAK